MGAHFQPINEYFALVIIHTLKNVALVIKHSQTYRSIMLYLHQIQGFKDQNNGSFFMFLIKYTPHEIHIISPKKTTLKAIPTGLMK